MDEALELELRRLGVDLESAIARFAGKQALYERFLHEFVNDETYAQLTAAMGCKDYKAALVAGHTLKGVAGNLGLTALYQACSQMVEHFRGNSVAAACDAYCTVQAEYAQIYELLLHAGR